MSQMHLAFSQAAVLNYFWFQKNFIFEKKLRTSKSFFSEREREIYILLLLYIKKRNVKNIYCHLKIILNSLCQQK